MSAYGSYAHPNMVFGENSIQDNEENIDFDHFNNEVAQANGEDDQSADERLRLPERLSRIQR